MKCHHQFKVLRTEDGPNRRWYFLKCEKCKKSSRRSRKLVRAQYDSCSPKTRQNRTVGQRKAIPKVSAKRRKELVEYSRLRKEFLEANPRCAVFPNRKSTQVHHGAGREGPWLLRQEDWLAVSDEGHEWIHQNPESAKQRGFLKLRITTDQRKHYEHTD